MGGKEWRGGYTPERVRDRASSTVLKQRWGVKWCGLKGWNEGDTWWTWPGMRWDDGRGLTRARKEKDRGQNCDIIEFKYLFRADELPSRRCPGASMY